MFFPLDQSNVLEHGPQSCKSKECNAMSFSKKITDQLTSDLSSLLLTFKIWGNKDSVVLAMAFLSSSH